ncbi:MAG: gamma-glutamyl-gamma-aminobutyrate hydrolase family protein [Desulfobulbaceae bacterium]|nr:gamma-glutamyl-gamma-aminobutyrate hydrolase family protein [Desulfobulbaceae bacterium]
MVFKVAVSQRVEVWAARGERRDALDQRMCQWLAAMGCLAMPVPNTLGTALKGARDEEWPGLQNWLLAMKPDAVLLSGGNDIGEVPERDNTERHLLTYAKDCVLPVLGICRGMQMMAVWAGASLVPVRGHVRTRHRLQAAANPADWPSEVNSFHDFALANCPQEFVVMAACVDDGTVEAIHHKILPWTGWMWHPEREPHFDPKDAMRFRALLDSRAAS